MKNKVVRLILILAILVIIIDQASKLLVTKFVTEPIGNDFLKIEVTNNTGMAFGFNEGNFKNICLTIFVLIIIISFVKNQMERIDTKTAIAVSMALGGGFSNLIDRFIRGGVLDFIKIYKFAVINVADIIIVCGWVLIIVCLIDFSKK
jgi:signal peptidase II